MFKKMFDFSRAEMRGILWLLPLLTVMAILIAVANRPRFERSFLQQVEEAELEPVPVAATPAVASDDIVDFDPNTLSADGFEKLGFSRRQAEAIVRYRTARGGFRSADDLARSYVVSNEMMDKIEPHIRIRPVPKTISKHVDRPASTPVAAPALVPVTRRVDINTADSAALLAVSGIGPALLPRIMDYRARLGGFVRTSQLLEIPGMTDENFTRVSPQIFADTCVIRKIDINFASPQQLIDALGGHPYVGVGALRKLLKIRQLKGGWRTIQELVNDDILTEEQAARLAPYVVFVR